MSFPLEIFLITVSVIGIGLLLGILTKFLSSDIFYPLISRLEKYLTRKSERDFEREYLRHIVEDHRVDLTTRDSANLSPKIRISDIYITPFMLENEGNIVKFSVKYFRDSDTRAFLIIGEPGSGKTSLLRCIQLNLSYESLSEERPQDRILPIYISLREHQNYRPKPLTVLLEESSPRIAEKQIEKNYYSKALKSGRLLILLDGLDEIRDEESSLAIIRSITDWSALHSDCKFIVTSRTRYLESVDIPFVFKKLTLLPFTDGQISEFIRKWSNRVFGDLTDILENPSPYEQNRSVLKRLTLENLIISKPELKELASNPMLLTLICVTHYFTGSIPINRTFLYQEIIDLLLERVKLDIPKHQILFVVEQIAYEYHINKVTVADRDFVRSAVEKSKKKFLVDFSSETVLYELINRSGLLRELDGGRISFIHYGFQEYFTAQYILDFDFETTSLIDLIDDQRWIDIILLCAESIKDISVLCFGIIDDLSISDLDKVRIIGNILAVSKKSSREEKKKIAEKVITEILGKEPNEYQHQMLLLASPHLSTEISTFIRGEDGD